MSCEYVRSYYGVPACIGRRVLAMGHPGVIAEDRGHYIGVNLDKDKAGHILTFHPTDRIEYLGIGEVRKATRSQARYRRWLEYGDGFDSFRDFLRWDCDPEREWNGRKA